MQRIPFEKKEREKNVALACLWFLKLNSLYLYCTTVKKFHYQRIDVTPKNLSSYAFKCGTTTGKHTARIQIK